MLFGRVLVLFLGATSAAGEKPKCAQVVKDLPGKRYSQSLSLELPDGLLLNGNDLGIDGHITTRSQCSIHDEASGTFGWNYDSGSTTKDCGKPPNKGKQCPYQVPGPDPKCHYQFGYHGVSYGITPWGEPSSTSKPYTLLLPVDTSTLKHLYTDVDVNYTWTDMSQPPVSKAPFYRSRLIYDFFLTKEAPVAHKQQPETITDEIIIDLGYNKDFQMACGYQGQSPAPLVPNFIKTTEGNFDLMDIVEGDKPCSQCQTNVRMTHFRRQGGECSGTGACKVNANLDLMVFINKAREYQPRSRVQNPGTYLGVVELGTEIYDNIKAEVTFKKFAVGAHPSSPPSGSAEVLV